MGKKKQRSAAEKIVSEHVGWAVAAGLVPLPLFDVLAVTSVQVDMLKKLARNYAVDYSDEEGKAWVTSLSASLMARVGANLFKLLPGVGTLLGGASMAVIAGASTYALGQVAAQRFATQGGLGDMDMDQAKRDFDAAYAEGKAVAEKAAAKGKAKGAPPAEAAQKNPDPIAALERLGKLRDKGVITEAEFEAKKAELLAQI